MGNDLRARPVPVVSGLMLLILRGILLWIVIPLATLAWLPAGYSLHRRGVSLGQFLGWVDLNLVACLERSILRPLFRAPLPWVPARSMAEVTHRVTWLDPM
jgi:hypothetical protein